jgi:hypothetical protein
MRSVLLGGALTALAALLAPLGARGVAHPAPLGGVNVGGISARTSIAAIDQAVASAQALHARVIRASLPWAKLEPLAGQTDRQALARADRLIEQAAAHGVRVVALVEETPCWDSSAPASLLSRCVPGQHSRANEWPPRDPGAYGAFTAFLARRYGRRLAAIEVWNEPDQANEAYFAGPDKARRYAAVLRAAYTAIKQADPAVPVLGASIVGSNGAFLKALYAAGIKGYYDGLSVHFYNLVLASLRSIHEVQLANGDHTPVWLNEFGWSSCWPRYRVQQEQGCVTRQVQAGNLADTVRSLTRTSWVAAEIVYELQGSRSEDFGVLTETGARKPAFAALSGALAWPFAKPSPVTVHLRRRAGRVVVSGTGPVGDYMHLEALRGKTPLYRALFTMDRFNRYRIALPRVLGTRALRVSVFQYWSGTARVARARI